MEKCDCSTRAAGHVLIYIRQSVFSVVRIQWHDKIDHADWQGKDYAIVDGEKWDSLTYMRAHVLGANGSFFNVMTPAFALLQISRYIAKCTLRVWFVWYVLCGPVF